MLRTTYSALSPGQFPAFDHYYRKVLGYKPIGDWPQWEAAGTVARGLTDTARNGTYVNVTLLQGGIGDGRICPSYNGTTSYTDIYSAALAGAFNGAEGTLMIWAKVSAAGVWTDAASRYLVRLRADANNSVHIHCPAVANTLE